MIALTGCRVPYRSPLTGPIRGASILPIRYAPIRRYANANSDIGTITYDRIGSRIGVVISLVSYRSLLSKKGGDTQGAYFPNPKSPYVGRFRARPAPPPPPEAAP